MDKTQLYYGKLIVRVTSADAAIPVGDATVVVRTVDDARTRIFAVMITDESGETDAVFVPTPSPSLSLSPSPGSLPYSTVNIEVSAPGYYDAAYLNVPVFSGITSVQNVNMLALPDDLPEGMQSPEVIVSESAAPDI
ncbi:MAG: hypothetical protein J5832_05985 [Clostridia bacterium]|nr:hypothetical protein [Clostridia bacterium]